MNYGIITKPSWDIKFLITAITFPGKEPSDPFPMVTCTFMFIGSTEPWTFLDNHDLYCLVDGERVEMPETAHKGEILPPLFDWDVEAVTEYVSFILSWEEFNKLCDAHKVEFKLGSREFQAEVIEFALWRQIRQTYLDLLEEKAL